MARPLSPPDPAPTVPHGSDILLLHESRPSMWVDMFAVLLFVVAIDRLTAVSLFVMVAYTDSSAGLSYSALEKTLFFPMLAVRAFTIVGAVAAVLRHRGQSALSVGLGTSKLAIDALCGLGSVAAAYVFIFAWQLVIWSVWPSLLDQMSQNAERIMSAVPRVNPAGLGLFALMVGIYEELFFRGFLMTRIRRAAGGWGIAVVGNTAVFTLLHSLDQTMAALVPITILSLVFSVVTIWRRSIVPAIVGHFVFDWCSLLFLYFAAGDAWQ